MPERRGILQQQGVPAGISGRVGYWRFSSGACSGFPGCYGHKPLRRRGNGFCFLNARYLFSSPWSQGGHFREIPEEEPACADRTPIRGKCEKWMDKSRFRFGSRQSVTIRECSVRYVRCLVLLRAEMGILSGRCFGKRLTDTCRFRLLPNRL